MSPTLSLSMTQAGMILGTAAYMSPEQARGKSVDKRADIWAFGVVLFELLTGRPLFGGGETASDAMAAVIIKEPDWNALPAATPASLRRLMEHCLRKDPKLRLRDIGDARILLDEPSTMEARPAVRRGAPWWTLGLAAALPVLILGGLLWRATQPVDRPLLRFSVDLGPEAMVTGRQSVIISPDGKRIAYSVRGRAGRMLATRLLSETKTTVLAGTENGNVPFFSPDSQWIGFAFVGKMSKISVQGGAAVPLSESALARDAYWGEDGYIYGGFGGGLARVPANGGAPEVLAKLKDGLGLQGPQLLPGGEAVLFSTAAIGNPRVFRDPDVEVYSLKTGQVKIVHRGGGAFARYLPSGHLIYAQQGTVFAVPFDLNRLETRGTPTPILDDLAGPTTTLDVSGNGTLVYLAGKASAESRPVVSMDQSGAQQTILAPPETRALTPRLSSDGKLLALAIGNDLTVYDPSRGSSTRLTFAPMAGFYPVWMPDAKHIIFSGAGDGVWWVRSDGSGKPERIYEIRDAIVQSVSPDGKALAFHQQGQSRDLYTIPLDLADPDHAKVGKAAAFHIAAGAQTDPAFSPDGRWLAYSSNEFGVYNVFVRPFPEGATGAGQVQISVVPGQFPVWSPTKKEIFYVADDRIMVVPYTVNRRAFSAGKPQIWCDTPIGRTGVNTPLDIAPDGKRFVVFPTTAQQSGGASNLHAVFLLNFFDELKRRAP